MTKNKSKAQRGTAVKRAEEIEAQFELYCVNSSVDDSNRGSKDAIEDLRVILEYPDLDVSDAKVFREAISKLGGVISTIDAVKEELSQTKLSKRPPGPDDLDGLPPGFGDSHPDDPDDETVIGRVKGKWVVKAWVNYHFSAIQVEISGYREARIKGVDVGDRSVTLAGDAWQPLVSQAVTEMRRRTGLPVSTEIGDANFSGIMPHMDFESDDGADHSELEEIAEELADILEELAEAPLPPQAA